MARGVGRGGVGRKRLAPGVGRGGRCRPCGAGAGRGGGIRRTEHATGRAGRPCRGGGRIAFPVAPQGAQGAFPGPAGHGLCRGPAPPLFIVWAGRVCGLTTLTNTNRRAAWCGRGNVNFRQQAAGRRELHVPPFLWRPETPRADTGRWEKRQGCEGCVRPGAGVFCSGVFPVAWKVVVFGRADGFHRRPPPVQTPHHSAAVLAITPAKAAPAMSVRRGQCRGPDHLGNLCARP